MIVEWIARHIVVSTASLSSRKDDEPLQTLSNNLKLVLLQESDNSNSLTFGEFDCNLLVPNLSCATMTAASAKQTPSLVVLLLGNKFETIPQKKHVLAALMPSMPFK